MSETVLGQELDGYFKKNKIKITLFPDNTSKSFKTFSSFKDYIGEEIIFWSNYNQGEFVAIKNHFDKIKSNLSNIQSNSENVTHQLQIAVDAASINAYPAIYSKTKAAKVLIELYEKNKTQATAALSYIKGEGIRLNRMDPSIKYDTLKGILDIHLFTLPNILDDKLDKTTVLLEKLYNKYNDLLTNLEEEFSKRNQKASDDYNKCQGGIAEFIRNKKEENEIFTKKHEDKLEAIEKFYHEKLRLESSASYWEKYSIDCKKDAKRLKWWAIVLTAVVVGYLTLILFNLPGTGLISEPFSIISIKAIIIFTLITSLLVYLIRLFIKLSLSSYHLSRDAKERHELTYLFLSLLNEDAIKPEDRNVILQALFSRADTGLLKGDSSPSMPEGVWGTVIKNMKGS